MMFLARTILGLSLISFCYGEAKYDARFPDYCAEGFIVSRSDVEGCHPIPVNARRIQRVARCSDAGYFNRSGSCGLGCDCYYKPPPTPTLTILTENCDCTCVNQYEGTNCDICPPRYDGPYCNTCSDGYIDYPLCRQCNATTDCFGRGSVRELNGKCKCTCRQFYTGDSCETCPSSFIGDDCDVQCAPAYYKSNVNCLPCNNTIHCNDRGEYFAYEPGRESECICKCINHYEGSDCNHCPSRFEAASNCRDCAPDRYGTNCDLCTVEEFCGGRGTTATAVGNNCVCDPCKNKWQNSIDPMEPKRCQICPSQYEGSDCNKCIVGRFGYPICDLCRKETTCSGHADSVTSDGQTCECRCGDRWNGTACDSCDPRYEQVNCDACAPGRIAYPSCVTCNNDEHCNGRAILTYPNVNATSCICECRSQWSDAHCGTCSSEFSGTDCDECQSGFVGYNNSQGRCRRCTNENDCNNHAQTDSNSGVTLVTSDPRNEKCFCRCDNAWTGDNCEMCPLRFNESDNCGSCQGNRVDYPLCIECHRAFHCNNRSDHEYANATKTGCICECENQWTGPTCLRCPSQYGGDQCNECASHYFRDSENKCVRRVPFMWGLNTDVSRVFKRFHEVLYPPIMVQLYDEDGVPMGDRDTKPPIMCTCLLRECQALAIPILEVPPLFSGNTSEGETVACCGDDPECEGYWNLSDPSCKVISQHDAPVEGDGCKCDQLLPIPPADEYNLSFSRMNSLRFKEDDVRISWYRPRKYEVVVLLKGLPVEGWNISRNDSRCDELAAITVQPLSINLRQPVCDSVDKVATLTNDSVNCVKCPEGLECYGHVATRTLEGYWRKDTVVLEPKTCPFGHCLGTSVSSTAEPEPRSAAGCAEGSDGAYCGRCVGENRLGLTGCFECQSQGINILLTIVMVLALVIGVVILVRLSLFTVVEVPDTLPQYIKILMSSIQILAVIKSLELPWVTTMQALLGFSRSVGSLGGIPSPAMCLLPSDFTMEDQIWVWVLLPLILLAEAKLCQVFFTTNWTNKLKKKDYLANLKKPTFNASGNPSEEDLQNADILPLCEKCDFEWADFHCKECDVQICGQCLRGCTVGKHKLSPSTVYHLGKPVTLPRAQIISTAFIILVHVSFTLLIDQLTRPFLCVAYLDPDSGYVSVAKADSRVSCNASSMVYQIAMVFFILYGLGIPVALAGILTREKHDLAKLRCIASYGFLYTNYRRKNYYWESVILVRKVLIVLSVGLPETIYSKCFAATWVLFFALILNLSFAPYRDNRQYQLDSLGLFAGSCSLLASLWVAENSRTNSPLNFPLLILVALFNTVTIVVISFFVIILVAVKLRVLFLERKDDFERSSDSNSDKMETFESPLLEEEVELAELQPKASLFDLHARERHRFNDSLISNPLVTSDNVIYKTKLTESDSENTPSASPAASVTRLSSFPASPSLLGSSSALAKKVTLPSLLSNVNSQPLLSMGGDASPPLTYRSLGDQLSTPLFNPIKTADTTLRSSSSTSLDAQYSIGHY